MSDLRKSIEDAIKSHSTPTIGRGEPHEGQAGYIIYARDGLPFVVAEIERAISERTIKTAEPSDDAYNKALSMYLDRKASVKTVLITAYAIDVAPLIAERDRLAGEVETLKSRLAEVRELMNIDLGSSRDLLAEVKGEVRVVVSGLTGSGKSAIAGEIEIALRAIGVQVEWPDGAGEKNTTHADWQTALELYKPRVVIIERNIPRTAK